MPHSHTQLLKWLNLHSQGCSDHTLHLQNENFHFPPGDGTKALTQKASLQPYQKPIFPEVVCRGKKPAKFAFSGLCILWWDQLSVLRANMFLTALWMLSLGFEVDCPCGSSEFPTRELGDESSLHPGMFLCFRHRAAPNALKKYA